LVFLECKRGEAVPFEHALPERPDLALLVQFIEATGKKTVSQSLDRAANQHPTLLVCSHSHD